MDGGSALAGLPCGRSLTCSLPFISSAGRQDAASSIIAGHPRLPCTETDAARPERPEVECELRRCRVPRRGGGVAVGAGRCGSLWCVGKPLCMPGRGTYCVFVFSLQLNALNSFPFLFSFGAGGGQRVVVSPGQFSGAARLTFIASKGTSFAWVPSAPAPSFQTNVAWKLGRFLRLRHLPICSGRPLKTDRPQRRCQCK